MFFERTATALGDVVEFGEYHRLLASAKGPRSKGDVWYRWEGHLWRMKTLRGGTSSSPSLVCVHGFGASCNQWERLTEALPHDIEHVVAVELLGFGLSAKPGISYTQHLCKRYVSDALSLIKGPVVLIGNSIGGGLCAGVSANHPGESRWTNLVQHGGQLVGCGAGQGRGRFGCRCEDAEPGFGAVCWPAAICFRRLRGSCDRRSQAEDPRAPKKVLRRAATKRGRGPSLTLFRGTRGTRRGQRGPGSARSCRPKDR